MPIIDDFVAGDYDVSLAHLDVLGLDCYGFAVDGATDGVA